MRRSLCLALVLALSGCSKTKGADTQSPASSMLKVEVPAEDQDAELWVDGNYVGVLGEFDDPRVGWPLLAPGVHRVEVRKPGRFPVQKSVEVPSDAPEQTVVQAELLADPR